MRTMTQGRSPLGLRGLKSHLSIKRSEKMNSRSPLGLRGLKSRQFWNWVKELSSQPTRAAWIEISRVL